MFKVALLGLVLADEKSNKDKKKSKVDEVIAKMDILPDLKDEAKKGGKIDGTLKVNEAENGKSITIKGDLAVKDFDDKCKDQVYSWYIHEAKSCKDVKDQKHLKDGAKVDPWATTKQKLEVNGKEGKLTIDLDTATDAAFKASGKTFSLESEDVKVKGHVIVVEAPEQCVKGSPVIACGLLGSAYLPAVGIIGAVLMMLNI